MPPAPPAATGLRTRLARNRGRQCELYGAPLGDRLRRLTNELGITQGRLAQALGVSPAMLSQLASARRVKIGDPAVLARLQLLDSRCATGPPRSRAAVDALLIEVAQARLQWTGTDARARGEQRPADAGTSPEHPVDALRALAPPARLAAAAATLAPAFPELADALRRAAVHPGTRLRRR